MRGDWEILQALDSSEILERKMKPPTENFKNPLSHSLAWHIKKLTYFIIMLVVPLQIQVINPLIFRAQRLDVFLRGLYVFY